MTRTAFRLWPPHGFPMRGQCIAQRTSGHRHQMLLVDGEEVKPAPAHQHINTSAHQHTVTVQRELSSAELAGQGQQWAAMGSRGYMPPIWSGSSCDCHGRESCHGSPFPFPFPFPVPVPLLWVSIVNGEAQLSTHGTWHMTHTEHSKEAVSSQHSGDQSGGLAVPWKCLCRIQDPPP